MLDDDGQPLNMLDGRKHIACPDGSCPGVIKESGQCGTCGSQYDWSNDQEEHYEKNITTVNISTDEKKQPTNWGWVGVVVFIFILIGMFNSGGEKKTDPPTAPRTIAESRQEKIQAAFSPWDGSHRGLEITIKASMNNPKSYEHVVTKYSDNGDHLIVATKFRGTNAFGGVVTNQVVAKTDLEGRVLEIISQGK